MQNLKLVAEGDLMLIVENEVTIIADCATVSRHSTVLAGLVSKAKAQSEDAVARVNLDKEDSAEAMPILFLIMYNYNHELPMAMTLKPFLKLVDIATYFKCLQMIVFHAKTWLSYFDINAAFFDTKLLLHATFLLDDAQFFANSTSNLIKGSMKGRHFWQQPSSEPIQDQIHSALVAKADAIRADIEKSAASTIVFLVGYKAKMFEHWRIEDIGIEKDEEDSNGKPRPDARKCGFASNYVDTHLGSLLEAGVVSPTSYEKTLGEILDAITELHPVEDKDLAIRPCSLDEENGIFFSLIELKDIAKAAVTSLCLGCVKGACEHEH